MPCQRARAQRDRLREALHRERGIEVFDDESGELAQLASLGMLTPKRGAELCLVAGAAKEENQILGDRHGDGVAVMLFDDGECEVDPGDDAGRSPDASVAEVDSLVHDMCTGVSG